VHRYKCENPECRYSKEGGVILKSADPLEKCPKCGYLVKEARWRKVNLVHDRGVRHEAVLVGMVTIANGLLKMGQSIVSGHTYAKLEAAQLSLDNELSRFRASIVKKPDKS